MTVSSGKVLVWSNKSRRLISIGEIIEGVENQFQAAASESVLHYMMWTLMIALLLGELIAYNYLI